MRLTIASEQAHASLTPGYPYFAIQEGDEWKIYGPGGAPNVDIDSLIPLPKGSSNGSWLVEITNVATMADDSDSLIRMNPYASDSLIGTPTSESDDSILYRIEQETMKLKENRRRRRRKAKYKRREQYEREKNGRRYKDWIQRVLDSDSERKLEMRRRRRKINDIDRYDRRYAETLEEDSDYLMSHAREDNYERYDRKSRRRYEETRRENKKYNEIGGFRGGAAYDPPRKAWIEKQMRRKERFEPEERTERVDQIRRREKNERKTRQEWGLGQQGAKDRARERYD